MKGTKGDSAGGQKELTVERSMADFKRAYQAKRKLIERQMEDFKFALGDQWNADDVRQLEAAGFKPFTDNRIQPNLFLLTGLERQNRTDFKAFPEGEEDGLKADIASALFKDAIKRSGFSFKSSEQFKDGITCGESHLELYLDSTEDLINGKPCWRKVDTNAIFPDPAFREYDFSDATFVYKLTLGISREDLINLYPEKKKELELLEGGKLDVESLLSTEGAHRQRRDYPTRGGSDKPGASEEGFDLIERYHKKWVYRIFIADKEKGELKEAENLEAAQAFVDQYKGQIAADQQAFEAMLGQHRATVDEMVMQAAATAPGMMQGQMMAPEMMQAVEAEMAAANMLPAAPPPPPERNPQRFSIIKRMVPEIWCFAHVPGLHKPLADERAWFYPKWKNYPFAPYFGRFSTAPLTGDDRNLLIQGVVHGVKGAQERHNKAEMLMLRHLNSSANSGWLAEEGAWLDREAVKNFGSRPGVDLEYKKGAPKPERIFPTVLSQGHAQISEASAEAIKAQLGINADLLATQQGGADSGRAIALRQRQGLLMVQELFDNLSRTRQIAGRMLLAMMGEMYDTETAMKVLGEGFLRKNFPPFMIADPTNPGKQMPAPDPETGRPMEFDKSLAEVAIAEVLKGDLGRYDVSVGEAVASESQRLANWAELKEISTSYPGVIPPDIVVRHSQLPEATKNEIMSAFQQAQARAMAPAVPPRADSNPEDAAA